MHIDSLKQFSVFVNYKNKKFDDGSVTKIPLNSKKQFLHNCDISDLDCWSTYSLAKKNAEMGKCDGVGIVLSACDHIFGMDDFSMVGIDIDAHHYDENPIAKEILEMFSDTYIERSPSGNGYHILCFIQIDKIPSDYKIKYIMKNSKLDIECYIGSLTNRYFTFTENAVDENKKVLQDETDKILAFLDKYMRKKQLIVHAEGSQMISSSLPVDELLDKARQSNDGVLFSQLYDKGDASRFPSESEARMRLCGMLAFWFSKDEAKVKEAYLESALYKNRPNKSHDADAVIQKAISNCTSTYRCSEKDLLDSKIWNFDGSGRYTLANLENFLEKNDILPKLNVISREVEVVGQVGKYDFKTLKSAVGIIYNYLNVLPKYQEQKIKDDLEYLAEKHKYNPILDIIQATTWDGADRIKELYSLLHITENIEKIFIRKWMQQCIAALLQDENNPFALDLVLVFTGSQGVGKTRLLEHLAIEPKYFSEGKSIDPTNKDSVREATSCWITELGEIGSTMKRDTDILKAFISQPKDTYRNPYAKGPDTYVRRTCFCGTANDAEYLIDETGNRRFLSITLSEDVVLPIDQIQKLDAKQLWAQVYKSVLDSELPPSRVFRFTPEEKQMLEEINKRHMKLLKGETEVIDLLAFLKTPDKYNQRYIEYQTVTDFKNRHDEYLHNYSSQQIAKVLKKLGYSVIRKRINGDLNPCKYYKLPAKHRRADTDPIDIHIIDETIE